MSGRARGSAGVGKGGAKRHRKVLRDNIQGVTTPAVRRLARRGGAKRIGGLLYGEIRGVLQVFLESAIRDAVTYTEHDRRRTVGAEDVVCALDRRGTTLYGFGGARTSRCDSRANDARRRRRDAQRRRGEERRERRERDEGGEHDDFRREMGLLRKQQARADEGRAKRDADRAMDQADYTVKRKAELDAWAAGAREREQEAAKIRREQQAERARVRGERERAAALEVLEARRALAAEMARPGTSGADDEGAALEELGTWGVQTTSTHGARDSTSSGPSRARDAPCMASTASAPGIAARSHRRASERARQEANDRRLMPPPPPRLLKRVANATPPFEETTPR